jgi:hypothetical protein
MMNGLTPRQITLAIAFPIVIAIFIVLGILVLRKDSKYWGNRFFALFFWLTALALSFNLSYLFVPNDAFVRVMNTATIFTVNTGIIALFLGNLIIYKGEDAIVQNKRAILILGILGAIIIGHLFVPAVISVAYDPRWISFFGFYELIFSQAMLVTVFYISFRFYRELEADIRKKFRNYLIGVLFLDITLLSITIDNMNVFGPGYATIGALLNFCVVIGAILIYFGIVRR